ncbi:MAG TPA: hypothetical protein VIV60_11555, partial [Polyangiaceae bacterium]
MTRIARDAAEAASHEENRAEGIKDMRSTEASYVARGQAERAVQLERTRQSLSCLDLQAFAPGDGIAASALVQLAFKGRPTWYFVLPMGGGRRVEQCGVVIHTVTPTSPLGNALLGLSVGDEAEVPAPNAP